jgi:hypothetical protein
MSVSTTICAPVLMEDFSLVREPRDLVFIFYSFPDKRKYGRSPKKAIKAALCYSDLLWLAELLRPSNRSCFEKRPIQPKISNPAIIP